MRALQIGGLCLQNGAVGQQPGIFLDIARHGRLGFYHGGYTTNTRMSTNIYIHYNFKPNLYYYGVLGG